MLNWIENYTKSLVHNPDQVSISSAESVKVVVVTLKVSDEDKDLFGGRNNRLSRALGVVLSLAGVKERRRYILKVAE